MWVNGKFFFFLILSDQGKNRLDESCTIYCTLKCWYRISQKVYIFYGSESNLATGWQFNKHYENCFDGYINVMKVWLSTVINLIILCKNGFVVNQIATIIEINLICHLLVKKNEGGETLYALRHQGYYLKNFATL